MDGRVTVLTGCAVKSIVSVMKSSSKNHVMMSFDVAIRTVFTKYADFTGRASRAEFWWWILFVALVSAVLGTLNVIPVGDNGQLGSLLNSIWSVIILLPTLAVGVRRLRDAGYEWGYIFFLLLPFAGAIMLCIFWAQATKRR